MCIRLPTMAMAAIRLITARRLPAASILAAVVGMTAGATGTGDDRPMAKIKGSAFLCDDVKKMPVLRLAARCD